MPPNYLPRNKDVSPGYASKSLTTSDTENSINPPLRSLYVENAGAVKFTGMDGTDDTWNVPSHSVISVRMTRVYANGTTATGLHAIY